MTRKFSIITLLIIMLGVGRSMALDIPKGTFYFDNSLTRYSVVKFVYGCYANAESYVVTMTPEGDDLWSVTIPQEVTGMYRYTFAETSVPDGRLNETFPNLKDRISNTLGEKRTATSELAIPVGQVFTPTSSGNWAQGYWKPRSSSGAAYSGTLPVMFITTEGNAPVTSKEEYTDAYYYIDNMGIDGVESVGSKDAPLLTQIRGRGNYTWWGFDKKPYRLKLDKKAALLGMPKSKHWGLLAHADDNLGFLRNTVGFELSRLLGLAWTPRQQPVEVVLNGDYIGLYMLTELVRVAKDRVNVVEQADYETDPEAITGGWLVEIDNYEEDEQVRTTEGNGNHIWSTYKTPELLSDEQRNYLTNLINVANAAIYNRDKSNNGWEQYIDPDTLACFYLTQELMDDTESFHGSCYWHKERGKDTKIMFGPVWDFGNAYHRNIGNFIYDRPAFSQTWIGEIAKFPHFQEIVKKHWDRFMRLNYKKIDGFIDDFIARIEQAAYADAARWPQYGNADILTDRNTFKSNFNAKVQWLTDQWGAPTVVTGDVNLDGSVNAADITAIYNIILGNGDTDGDLLQLADVNGDGSVNAADVTAVYNIILGNGVKETGITIYVQATEAPYLYSWLYTNGTVEVLNGDWPGTQMSDTATTPDGRQWWVHHFDIENTAINIIFNAGSSRAQTSDITDVGPGSHYYIYDGNRSYQEVK